MTIAEAYEGKGSYTYSLRVGGNFHLQASRHNFPPTPKEQM
jgi:hypothetical protein